MQSRGETPPSGYRPEYGFAELVPLIGGRGERAEEYARAAVRRLERAGLLMWSGNNLEIARSPEQLRSPDRTELDLTELWSMLELAGKPPIKVPVPRRILRFLAGGARPVVAATVVAHLLRCMRYRQGKCLPSGGVKAPWVAKVFGVNAREVKRARAHLVQLGWLIERERPQYSLNSSGLWVTVNLAWSRTNHANPVDNSPVGERRGAPTYAESPPPCRPNPGESPPPDSDRELPTGQRDQKPSSAGGRAWPGETSGFSVPTARPQEAPTAASQPTLQNITPEDLRDMNRLLELFRLARKGGERERNGNGSTSLQLQSTLAASGPEMPPDSSPGWFAMNDGTTRLSMTRRRLNDGSRSISTATSGAAHRRPIPSPARPRSLENLSEDARFVQALRRELGRRGIGDERMLLLVQRERPEWTQPRWEEACAELEAWTLGGSREHRSSAEVLLGALGIDGNSAGVEAVRQRSGP